MQTLPEQVMQVGSFMTNLGILGLLLEMRFKVGMLWRDYLKRKKLNGDGGD